MSSRSYTSYLENLNESSSTKYGLLSHTCTNQLFRTKRIYICYDSSEISTEDNSDLRIKYTYSIGNTNWCRCGNCSKMETSTESLCREILEICDERFTGIYNYVYFISCMICNDSLC